MKINETYRKEIDENGNEVMVLIERTVEPIDEPSVEDLQAQAQSLMIELQNILNQLSNGE